MLCQLESHAWLVLEPNNVLHHTEIGVFWNMPSHPIFVSCDAIHVPRRHNSVNSNECLPHSTSPMQHQRPANSQQPQRQRPIKTSCIKSLDSSSSFYPNRDLTEMEFPITTTTQPTSTTPPKSIPRPRKRLCSIPGCKNGVVQGGVCVTHGAKRRKCKFPGCDKNSKCAGLCSKHG